MRIVSLEQLFATVGDVATSDISSTPGQINGQLTGQINGQINGATFPPAPTLLSEPFAEPLTASGYIDGSITIKDANGKRVAVVFGDTAAETIIRAHHLIATSNLCAGLPLDGILAGFFAVTDIRADDDIPKEGWHV